MKIKAAVVEEPGKDYEIQHVTLQEPTGKDILVKIVATGICGSDFNVRQGSAVPTPNVLGHEGAGIVEAIGDQVTEVEVGDHVVLSYSYCQKCEACNNGHPSSCDSMKIFNYSGRNTRGEWVIKHEDGRDVASFFNQGSFATHSLVDESNVIKVSKENDLRIMGPLTCGLTTGSGAIFNVLKPDAGSSVLVFGAGAVGYAAIMAAKIVGCYPIIAVDINDSRLDMATELGATHTINGNTHKDNVIDMIKEINGGRGVNYSIDTTGVPPVIKQAIEALQVGGSMVPLAMTNKQIELNTFRELSNDNKKIVGVLMGDTIPKYHIPKLISYYEKGQFPFDKLVKFYEFEDINQAETDAMTGKVFKSVLVIDKEYQAPK